VSSFVVVETIVPWVGTYHPTGRRSRTISLDKALVRILMVAGIIAVVVSLALMIYLGLAAPVAD
jgi:hypothetical protein